MSAREDNMALGNSSGPFEVGRSGEKKGETNTKRVSGGKEVFPTQVARLKNENKRAAKKKKILWTGGVSCLWRSSVLRGC